MPRVFYLPGTDGADSYTDKKTKTIFMLDPDGRAVAAVTEKEASAFRGIAGFWVEGDATSQEESAPADAAPIAPETSAIAAPATDSVAATGGEG